MNEMITVQRSLYTFGSIMAGARFEIFICRDPYHVHQSPIQEMMAVWYRGHHVAITKDGTVYSIRIDRRPSTDRHGLSESEAIAYVERNCKEVRDVR